MALDGLVFDDRLDDQLPIRNVGQVGGERQPTHRGVALALGDLAGAHPALQRLHDACPPGRDQRLCGLENEHVHAGAGGDFRNACAHLPGTDDSHAFNRIAHCISPSQHQAPPKMTGGA